MKLHPVRYSDLRELIHKKIVLFGKREKTKNFNRDIAVLSFFVFSLVLIPIGIMILGMARKPYYINGWVFFIVLSIIEIWLFVFGYNSYKLHKKPLNVFWKYFITRKAELFVVGIDEIDGKEYMVHGFKERGSGVWGTVFVMTLSIRKDIEDQARELMKEGKYEIAVDKYGKEKVVVNGGERVVEVDRDTLLVMKLIETIYALYRGDMQRILIKKHGNGISTGGNINPNH